jgi:quercetin dioxygenase-like cupin family protein
MGVVEEKPFRPLSGDDDPDDYRPGSRLAVVVDRASRQDEFVHGVAVLFEQTAPGDRIPLHRHGIAEVLVIDEGAAEVRLGDEVRRVGPGAVVFVPAGTAHGIRNIGVQVLRVHAFFPSEVVSTHYLERNPAPGTEGDLPRPPVTIDLRALAESDAVGS